VSDVVGERLSFARPGSSDNENRPLASLCRYLLLRIQVIQPRKFRWNAFVKMGHKSSIAESSAGWQVIPSIAGVVNLEAGPRISCHYTSHPINCDLKNKSTHAFVPFVTA
jgi:hypothetical protein